MQAGEVIANRYRVDARAGAGAMGVVYRGTDSASGRPVAIKVLRDPWGDALARFRREAEVLATLADPRIVGYLAHGITAAGEAFLVMEWLSGETLKDRLARAPLTGLDAVRIGRGIAEALAAAHARGVVHRDLKPANVFLVGGSVDAVKVVDFGLARLTAGDRTRTASGAMLGTPAYMAPEQALGGAEIDARADVFALGAILFEGLTGSPPFERETLMATLLALTTQRAPSLASSAGDAPGRLVVLVDAMLARDPAMRPRDGAVVARELRALERDGAIASWSPRPSRRAAALDGPTLAPTSTPTLDVGRAGDAATVLTAPPSAGRSAAPLVALGGLAVVALAATVGVVALQRGAAAKHPQRSATSSEGLPPVACPDGALACERFEPEDPTHVDGFAAIDRAVSFAAEVRTGAELADATLLGVSDGALDLDGGSTLMVNTTHRMTVQLRGHLLIVWNAPFDAPKGTRPGCSLADAYASARRAGLPRSPSANLVVSAANAPTSLLVSVVDGAHSKQIALDAKTCAPR